ncbi:MAG: hypothetical protein H8E44_16375 [Planctomycetes bacterium]|nr:hypothetical protein [Planctomycetota bacterium]
MNADNASGFGMPDPLKAASHGESPFAKRRRTVMGKVALGLSLIPWATYGLMCVFQPG